MREVVLDTETTGIDPAAGHRIVEIGAVELVNHIPSGRRFQRYLNPERDMPQDAERVHGLTRAFLAKHRRFAQEADEVLAFIGEAKLVMHNAPFDLGFLNAELERIHRSPIPVERTVDTLTIARRKYPGAPASLDALCRRFGIDRSMREKHGALLDAELLTEVYLELTGGRQPGLALQRAAPSSHAAPAPRADRAARPPRRARTPPPRPRRRLMRPSSRRSRTRSGTAERRWGGRRACQPIRAITPPSTGSATPVMKRPASEARKSEAWATSQALPMPPLRGLQVSRVAAISSRGLP